MDFLFQAGRWGMGLFVRNVGGRSRSQKGKTEEGEGGKGKSHPE